MDGDLDALPPIARPVLWPLIGRRERFRPFDREARAFCVKAMATSGENRVIDARKVQRVIGGLHDRAPPLVWRSARAEYALEDIAMQRWHDAHVERGTWPPGPSA